MGEIVARILTLSVPVRVILVTMARMILTRMILTRMGGRIVRFGLVRGPGAGMMRLGAHALMKYLCPRVR
jgi:hypothetical protein